MTSVSYILEPFAAHKAHLAIDTLNLHQAYAAGADSDEDEMHIGIEDSDGETASQHSVSLFSPTRYSPARNDSGDSDDLDAVTSVEVPYLHEPTDVAITPVTLIRQGLHQVAARSKRDSQIFALDSDQSPDTDDRSLFMRRLGESPVSFVTSAVDDYGAHDKGVLVESPSEGETMQDSADGTYPPLPLQQADPRSSFSSLESGSTAFSKKARPESMLVDHKGPLVLGIAVVDFNHLVGPKIEFSRGEIFEDEEVSKILPFLALPDGAHLTVEDYSYFHLVPNSPNPTTLFGISCNRQIRTADLIVKEQDMTRSTVQKAVVVLASKPVFGPIRDRLGVITRALFAQRDFTDMSILDEFHTSLEMSLRSQLTESGLYMGTSLRELVHTFRQRTLVLLKALMLQKKIMFYGHPVEKLCTYQYSLVALIPGLLQHLDDCGSPPLATRAAKLSKPTELRTSDPRSVMAFIGLPLELFGKDAFFQPYLPLQQMDLLKDTQGWLCGSTNSIVTQQKEIDVLVNVETGLIEFRDPKVERSAALTPADRKWMDDVVKDVNEGWDESDPLGAPAIQFKGSDDYLRQKFDEYISGALSCVKYSSFLAKGQGNGVVISDGTGNPNAVQDFNALWISEFKKTNAYVVWDRVTDPLVFDIIEPRHPCSERPSVVADIGLRLSEGIQDLKLDQQLDTTREALSRTFAAGSTGFFKAVEGVRGRWMQRSYSTPISAIEKGPNESGSSSIVEVSKSDADSVRSSRSGVASLANTPEASPLSTSSAPTGMRPFNLSTSSPQPMPVSPQPSVAEAKPVASSWGAGISAFFSSKASRLSMARASDRTTPPREASPAPSVASSASRANSLPLPADLGLDEIQPRNLDEIYGSLPTSHPSTPPVVSIHLEQPAAQPHHDNHERRGSTSEEDEHEHDDDEDAEAGTGVAL